MTAQYYKYTLNFKQPSGTSRGILTTKDTWFIIIKTKEKTGVGECSLLQGLSIDDRSDYEEKLQWACKNITLGLETLLEMLVEFPSIQFGLEMAYKSLEASDKFQLFPSAFTKGKATIPINGLIWMGTETFIKHQIKKLIKSGFTCLKMKIGAIDFNTEINLLKTIRSQYNPNDIELRVDANGAFSNKDALDKLKYLADLEIHSIEQPIKPKQPQEMARLCEDSPLPIALDEELIGVFSVTEKELLIQTIKPQYIILKPSLVGGFSATNQWLEIAEKTNTGWWVTSALESNIGLNAIAQWTFTLNNTMPQGLGTGSLFTNNFDSPLQVKKGTLQYNPKQYWNFNL